MSQIQSVHVDQGAQAAGLMRAQTRGTQALIRVEARDIKRVESAAIVEAQLLGYAAVYGWGQGQDRIEGPAWPLTKSLMRVYGNCSLDMDPVQDLPDAWVFTARAVDMETGYSISRQFRQSKNWKVYGKHDEARKEDVRFQIGQSKALRNVALAFLPDWLVDRAMDAAKGGMRERIEKLVAEQMDKVSPDLTDDEAKAEATLRVAKAAFAKLASMGITEERGLWAVGRKNLAGVTIEDLVVIRGGIAAVEKGTDTADEVFPVPAKAAEVETGDLLTRIKQKAATVASPTMPQEPAAAKEAPDGAILPADAPAAKEPGKDAAPAVDPSDPLAGAAPNPDTALFQGGDPGPSKPTTVARPVRVKPKHPVA